jgi:hypothetical protein
VRARTAVCRNWCESTRLPIDATGHSIVGNANTTHPSRHMLSQSREERPDLWFSIHALALQPGLATGHCPLQPPAGLPACHATIHFCVTHGHGPSKAIGTRWRGRRHVNRRRAYCRIIGIAERERWAGETLNFMDTCLRASRLVLVQRALPRQIHYHVLPATE